MSAIIWILQGSLANHCFTRFCIHPLAYVLMLGGRPTSSHAERPWSSTGSFSQAWSSRPLLASGPSANIWCFVVYRTTHVVDEVEAQKEEPWSKSDGSTEKKETHDPRLQTCKVRRQNRIPRHISRPQLFLPVLRLSRLELFRLSKLTCPCRACFQARWKPKVQRKRSRGPIPSVWRK